MKRRQLFWLLLVFSPVFLAFRFFQLIKTIDSSNGFYFDNYKTITTVSSIVLLVVCLAAIVISRFFISEDIAAPLPNRNSRALGVCSVLVAAGLGADAAVYYKMAAVATKFTAIQMVLALMTAVAAVIMLVAAYQYFCKKHPSPGITITMVVWGLMRLFVRYTTRFNGLAMVSENVYDIFAMCCVMMFLLFYAHMYSGSNTRNSAGWVLGFGWVGTVFCLVTTVPKIVLAYTNPLTVLSHCDKPSYANLAFTVFMLVFLFLFSSRNAESANDETQEFTPIIAKGNHFVKTQAESTDRVDQYIAPSEDNEESADSFIANYSKNETIDDIYRRCMSEIDDADGSSENQGEAQ